MEIDLLSIIWESFVMATGMWLQVIATNPWPWVLLVGLAVVASLIPSSRRRRRV